MLLVRDVQTSDLPALRELARVLNSVNLPADDRALAGIIERSRQSFACRIPDPLRRSYLFVAEDPRRRRVLGCSMVIAQHGTRESPCTFFDVAEREHYSSTLDRHFRHTVLSLGFHFDGPTEIGGLVVHPAARRREEQPGKQLSFVRFLYMAMYPGRFRETVLAELMPPLSADGRSAFWESCGRRFTGLDYQEADKMSRRNKEFIQQLFPASDLYATLLPPRVRARLGAVGPEAEGARRLLERVGFRYVNRIDPFDGGPHYEARLRDISVVRTHREAKASGRPPPRGCPEWLVGVSRPRQRIRFRAVRSPARIAAGEVELPADALRLLGARPGDRVHLLPLEGGTPPVAR
ncbi:MAG TPA: arginine N-succinyltransferase [Anaeromyxobacteraceae bacterium]|nr:arginine N-succinyltransferase [Anaeromyxobacteraceae bacterium]